MNESVIEKKSTKSKATQSAKACTPKKLKTLLKTARCFGFPGNETYELAFNSSSLTTFDHMAIALEHAALAMHCLEQITSTPMPILAMSCTTQGLNINLREVICHLHDALNNSLEKKEFVRS